MCWTASRAGCRETSAGISNRGHGGSGSRGDAADDEFPLHGQQGKMAILERETMGHLSDSRAYRDTAGGRELIRRSH